MRLNSRHIVENNKKMNRQAQSGAQQIEWAQLLKKFYVRGKNATFVFICLNRQTFRKN